MGNYIKITDVSKKIGEQLVLNDISLNIDSNTIVGLVGKNGSGKTMLLRAIAGLIKVDEGYVQINGSIIGEKIEFPIKTGIIIENVGLWEYMTGFKALKLLASINNLITEDDIKETIRRVGLDPNDKKHIAKYSLGMKKRLMIAQAIMEKPDLLLLDEPTSALDDEGVKLFYNIIKEEQERGATIIMASHLKDDIDLLCDTIYRLDQGKVEKIK